MISFYCFGWAQSEHRLWWPGALCCRTRCLSVPNLTLLCTAFLAAPFALILSLLSKVSACLEEHPLCVLVGGSALSRTPDSLLPLSLSFLSLLPNFLVCMGCDGTWGVEGWQGVCHSVPFQVLWQLLGALQPSCSSCPLAQCWHSSVQEPRIYNSVYPGWRGLCCFCCHFDRCLHFTGWMDLL